MDAWIYEYEKATQSSNEISASINEYHQQTKDSVQTAKLSATIRRSLVQLTKDIATLEDGIRNSTQITERERTRRGDLIRSLTVRKDQLSDSLNRNPTSREELVGSGGVNSKKRAWGQKIEETEHTKDLSNDQLLSQQKGVMTEQDGLLDALSASVAKQKDIAITIDGELNIHGKLITDLDVKTENTTLLIKNTTKKVDKITEKSKVCGMWICIIILIVVIIVLAATDWGCKIYYVKDRCS